MHQETFNLSVNFCQTCCSCKSVDKNRIEGEDSATTRVILFMFNKPYSFKLIIPSAFIHQIKVKAIMPTLNNEGLLVQPNFVFLCFKIHFVCKAHKGMLAISGSCSQVRAERDWLSDWGFFFFFCSDADAEPDFCDKERPERESKAVNLPIDIRPYPHLWLQALGCGWKNEITDTNGGN